MVFDIEALKGLVESLGPQNCERLAIGALSIAGMGAAWLSLRGVAIAARLGYRGSVASIGLVRRLLTPAHGPLCQALLSALDDRTAVVQGAKLKTIRFVCDFSKKDLLVGEDEVTPLLTKREIAALWAKARTVRQGIEEREAEEMRQVLLSEIRGEDIV